MVDSPHYITSFISERSKNFRRRSGLGLRVESINSSVFQPICQSYVIGQKVYTALTAVARDRADARMPAVLYHEYVNKMSVQKQSRTMSGLYS